MTEQAITSYLAKMKSKAYTEVALQSVAVKLADKFYAELLQEWSNQNGNQGKK